MRYKTLGKSDLKVSVVGQGTGQFGTKTWGYGSIFKKEEITDIIRSDLEHGINLFDTAETYADGLSETLLGNALSKYKRDDFVVISKVAPWNLRHEDVIKAANRSISRLGLGYIDLFLVHYTNQFVQPSDTFSGLERLVKDGKVRYIGTSNFQPIQLKRAQESCRREEIIANEIEYNIVSRFSEKYTIPFCVRNNIGILTFSPLAGGVLTGKYFPGHPPNDRARMVNFWAKSSFVNQTGPLLETLKKISQRESASISQVALSWIIAHKSCIPIPASLTPKEAEENSRAGELILSAEDVTEINSVAPRIGFPTYFFDHFLIRPIAWIRGAVGHNITKRA